MLKSLIITKWIEPYVVLERFKDKFECEDLTFDGSSKLNKQQEFYTKIENSKQKSALGLYLKNVNKFYVMTSDDTIEVIKDILKPILNLNDNDFQYTRDCAEGLGKIDMAKAEVCIIVKE